MKFYLLFITGWVLAATPVKAQPSCSETLSLSLENINKIISALQDHSIRGTSLGSSSAGYTEWNSTLCLDNQTKTGIVYSSSYSDGV